MDAGTSPARQARMKHRHELRSLTYVTLDQSNGGIVRNLSRDGIGVQAVAAVPPLQEVRIRFELRYPRVRVEARGLVVWSTFSGQCGIRFVDLAPSTTQHIQEWIFGNLLERAWLHADQSMFAAPVIRESPRTEEDGLLLSPTAVRVIELPDVPARVMREEQDLLPDDDAAALDWFWHPLSGAGLSWTVNVLAVIAGLLLFALVFLSVAQETPSWPVVLSGAAGVPAMYWGFFQLFGGCSLGERLARLSAGELEEAEEPAGARFR